MCFSKEWTGKRGEPNYPLYYFTRRNSATWWRGETATAYVSPRNHYIISPHQRGVFTPPKKISLHSKPYPIQVPASYLYYCY